VNRRDWLIACGRMASGAALGVSAGGCVGPPGVPSLPLPGVDDESAALPPHFLSATFEPTEDTAIAWLGSMAPTVAHLELWPDGELSATPVASVELTEEGGLVGAIELHHLRPNTEHRYRVFFEGTGYGPWLRFRTAPDPQALEPLSFLFSADVGLHAHLEGAYGVLAREEADVYLHLGDWPYADQAPAARSISEFRERHRALREPYAIQEWLWTTPVIPIYDDHDIRENWAGVELRETEPGFLATGLAAWHEYFPLGRQTSFRDLRWGKLAHFFVVDTRLYRDRRDPLREGWKLLGDAQLAWLVDGLRGSDAAFKILVSTVPFGFDGYEDDDWSAFFSDRADVLEAVREAQIDPLIVISADRHWFAARHLEDGVREYQVGPLTAGLGKYPDAFPSNVVASALARNFGRIDIRADAAGDRATLTFTCKDIEGNVLYTEGVATSI
jgi:alkaline phosphatase D